MRKLVVLLVVLLAVVTAVLAQPPAVFAQKFGVEAGYSYLRANLGGGTPGSNANGFEVQPLYQFSRHWAVVGDFTGSYGTLGGLTLRDYFYGGGPALVIPFSSACRANVHVLFGANHVDLSDHSGRVTDTAFAMAPGGALDFKISRKVYFRAAEVDYIYTRDDLNSLTSGVINSKTQNHFRYGVGLLFLF